MANTLPSDFRPVLDSVWSDIRSGKVRLDSSQALAEAWRRWRKKHGQTERTVQQRRYAYRKSFENPHIKKPQDVEIREFPTIGQWHLIRHYKNKEIVIGIFHSASAALKARNRYLKTGSWKDVNPAPTERARRFFGAELSRRRHHKPTQTKLPTRELEKMASRNAPRRSARSNPIAIYNPAGLQLIYGRAQIPEVYGVKTSGAHKGKKFVHKFKTDVKIYGLPHGALMVQSLDGSRLWADERDLDKFDRS